MFRFNLAAVHGDIGLWRVGMIGEWQLCVVAVDRGCGMFDEVVGFFDF